MLSVLRLLVFHTNEHHHEPRYVYLCVCYYENMIEGALKSQQMFAVTVQSQGASQPLPFQHHSLWSFSPILLWPLTPPSSAPGTNHAVGGVWCADGLFVVDMDRSDRVYGAGSKFTCYSRTFHGGNKTFLLNFAPWELFILAGGYQ